MAFTTSTTSSTKKRSRNAAIAALLLLSTTTSTTCAFTPTSIPTASKLSSSSLPAASVVSSSEWYSPPPPQPAASTTSIPLQHEITSAAEFDDLIYNSNDDRITIVKFYASWCKSCAKFSMKLDQLASQQADHVSRTSGAVVKPGSVRILTVEYGAAKALCASLGIKKLPTVHMYRSNGTKLQDFSCPPNQFHRITDLLAGYQNQQQQQTSLQDTLQAGHALIQDNLSDAYVHPIPNHPNDLTPSQKRGGLLGKLFR